jgi:hypothetical protein
VRVPEHDGQTQRARERGGEDCEHRRHVRDHAQRALAQLGGERTFEPQTASGFRARSEGTDATVRRQSSGNGGVCEHDDLVEPLRERRDLRDRRRESRVLGVDLLRYEDELAHA